MHLAWGLSCPAGSVSVAEAGLVAFALVQSTSELGECWLIGLLQLGQCHAACTFCVCLLLMATAVPLQLQLMLTVCVCFQRTHRVPPRERARWPGLSSLRVPPWACVLANPWWHLQGGSGSVGARSNWACVQPVWGELRFNLTRG